MELMQLEMFVAMVEEGNFHKAAEKVFRTQPAVSMALRKLEREIGSPLFDRSSRNAYVLTDTGVVLYEHARRLLNLRDETIVALEELHSLQTGRIRLGANESASLFLLPRLILAFREKYPKIKIEVIRQLSERLPYELRQRNLDFAILSFQPEEGDLEATPIMRDELVLIAAPDHSFAGQERVQIPDLGGESFIVHQARSSSRKKVLNAFRKSQTPFNVTIEISTIETVKKFVAMKLGLAFVPRMCVSDELARGELVIIPVDDFHHERTLWLVRRRTDPQSHAAQAFLRVIAQLAEERLQTAELPASPGKGEMASGTIN